MNNSNITDPLFGEAIDAIDAGNIVRLKQLLRQHPQLIHHRMNVPEEGYFKHPYLLWFIADNPIRNKKLPANIVEVTKVIIETLQNNPTETYNYQLSYTLGLVATGRIPKECGVQIELIDLLIDAGASVGMVHGALAHNNIDAAAHIINKGGTLTLAAAVGLNRMDDVVRLIKHASAADMQVALVVASFFGNAKMISFLLKSGVDVNARPNNFDGFHSHAPALHQAVYSGSLPCVQLLAEAGASLDATDRIYQGTPLGWAIHMQNEDTYNVEDKSKFREIESYLKIMVDKCGSSGKSRN